MKGAIITILVPIVIGTMTAEAAAGNRSPACKSPPAAAAVWDQGLACKSPPAAAAVGKQGLSHKSPPSAVVTEGTVSESGETCTVEWVLNRYLEALGGRGAIEALSTRVSRGLMINDLSSRTPPVYEKLRIEAFGKHPGRLLVVKNKEGKLYREGFDGKTTWEQRVDRIGVKEKPIWPKEAWLFDPRGALRMEDYFPGLKAGGREEFWGVEYYVLVPEELDEAHYKLFFDVESGLLARIGYYWELHDYRVVDGVKVPFRIDMSRKGGKSSYVFEEISHNVPLDDAIFSMPDTTRGDN